MVAVLPEDLTQVAPLPVHRDQATPEATTDTQTAIIATLTAMIIATTDPEAIILPLPRAIHRAIGTQPVTPGAHQAQAR